MACPPTSANEATFPIHAFFIIINSLLLTIFTKETPIHPTSHSSRPPLIHITSASKPPPSRKQLPNRTRNSIGTNPTSPIPTCKPLRPIKRSYDALLLPRKSLPVSHPSPTHITTTASHIVPSTIHPSPCRPSSMPRFKPPSILLHKPQLTQQCPGICPSHV